MTLTYQQSFSASLDDNGAQKAMPLPALTKGITYNFNVGFDSGWRTYWDNPSGFYITYETPYNYSGSYAGQPKNASGSFAFSATNQKFNTSSLINDDYKWSVNGAFGAGYLQNASITFTPEVDVAISESFLRVIGENDFIISIDNLGSYIFSTKAELQTAVNLWISDNTAALATYGEINTWVTTAIVDMSEIFFAKSTFNSDISNWDVSNVTDMNSIFKNAVKFNQPLSNWDVSNVTDMNNMFDNTHRFDQPIGVWNVSNVTNMFRMFNSALDFNQNINNWNVSNVTNMDFMFSNANTFQQPLNLWQPNSLLTSIPPSGKQNFMGNTGALSAITYNLYDALLNGWVVDFAALPSNVNISFGDSTFTAAGLAARNILVNDKGWTITDGGQV